MNQLRRKINTVGVSIGRGAEKIRFNPKAEVVFHPSGIMELKPAVPDSSPGKLLPGSKRRIFTSSAGTLLDIGGRSVPDVALGSLEGDWNAIGRDFRAIGDDMTKAIQADFAKRAAK